MFVRDCREGNERSRSLLIRHLRLLALLAVLDVGLNLLLHPIPYIVLSKSVVRSFDTLMSGDRGIMEVRDKQLVLFIRAISDVDQLNSYWIQEYLILIIVA